MGSSMVVAMRHTEVQSGNNPTHFDPSGHCQGENLLTARGRDQAREIGALFARNGIKPIVIYSPMCRTKETARLAFGEPGQTHDDLREISSADQGRRQQFLKISSAMLTKAAGPQVVVFIGHAPNLFELTMEQSTYGVGLVGSITAQGDIDSIGKIKLY
jgi:phosphohistidine phosphatase SixA